MFSLLVQGAFWGLLEQVIPRLETLVEYIGSMDLFIDSEIFGVRWSMSSMCDLRKSVRVPVSKNTLHSFWALISGHTSPLRVDGWHGLASGRIGRIGLPQGRSQGSEDLFVVYVARGPWFTSLNVHRSLIPTVVSNFKKQLVFISSHDQMTNGKKIVASGAKHLKITAKAPKP